MISLCTTCDICNWLPKQREARTLSLPLETDGVNPVLVIDDLPSPPVLELVERLLGDVKYTYTNTIRCEHDPEALTPEQLQHSISHCAVWTHQLLTGRALILTTSNGLKQMGIQGKYEPGDAFRSPQFGVVLCIPALHEVLGTVEKLYSSKVQRVLKHAGLLS